MSTAEASEATPLSAAGARGVSDAASDGAGDGAGDGADVGLDGGSGLPKNLGRNVAVNYVAVVAISVRDARRSG